MPEQRLDDCQIKVLHTLPTNHVSDACHATAAYSLVARALRRDGNRSRVLDFAADRARKHVRHVVTFSLSLIHI